MQDFSPQLAKADLGNPNIAGVIMMNVPVIIIDKIKADNSRKNELNLHQIKDFSEVIQSQVPQPMNGNVSWHKIAVTTSSDFGAGNLYIMVS